jgi:hypothetical protein
MIFILAAWVHHAKAFKRTNYYILLKVCRFDPFIKSAMGYGIVYRMQWLSLQRLAE